MKNFLKQVGRVSHELVLSSILLFLFLTGDYASLSPTVQLLMLKVILTSLGFLHATIANKIAFPDIDWSNADADKTDKIRATVLYAVFIYSYAQAG